MFHLKAKPYLLHLYITTALPLQCFPACCFTWGLTLPNLHHLNITLLYLYNASLPVVPPKGWTLAYLLHLYITIASPLHYTFTMLPCPVSDLQTRHHPTCSSFSASWALRRSTSARALSRHKSLFAMVACSSVTLASSLHSAVS